MTHHIETVRWYVTIFAWLMGLLVLTVVAAYLPLGALGLAVALTIAFVKALLVVLYFMHVRYAGKVVWVFAGAGVIWLGIMLTLTFADYLTRPVATPQATSYPAPDPMRPSQADLHVTDTP